MAIQRLGSSGTTWVISDAFVLNREKCSLSGCRAGCTVGYANGAC